MSGNDKHIVNIDEALRWAKQQLKSSTTPELDARVILMHVLHLNSTELLSRTNDLLPIAKLVKFRKMVAN